MVSALINSERDSFSKFLGASLIIHVSFLVFFALKAAFLPSQSIERPQSIRVDVVALPDKIPDNVRPTPKESQVPENVTPPTPIKREVEKSKAKESHVDLKKTQKSAIDKIKALEALEKFKKEVAAANKAQTTPPPAPTMKGNIISSGNDFSGLSKLRVNEYLDKLMLSIREHWVLPQWLTNANLKATLLVEIDDRGYIVRNEIQVSSSNEVFDSLCTDAVSKSSPVDPPPNEIRGALITVRFPFE